MIRDTSQQDEIIENQAGNVRKKYLITISLAAVTLTLVLGFPSYQQWSAAEQTIALDRVRMANVIRGDLNRDVSAQGSLIAAIKPTLFSPADGVVTLVVNAGDSVNEGTLIAEIDSPELIAMLDEELASEASGEVNHQRQQITARKIALENQQKVDLAEVALIATRRELRRAEAAHKREAISEFDYDKANDDVATAELRFEHATQDAKLQEESLAFEIQTSKLELDRQKIRVVELKRQVRKLRILSPVTGIVGNLLAKNKDAVNKNQPLLTVVDLSAFEVELKVPDSYASILAIGLAAEVSHQGSTYPAKLVAISPEVINSQITAKVKFVDQIPENLKQNQRVSARILLEGKTNTLLVERGPFLESSGGRYTYIVENNLAKRTPIETGLVSVANIEVLSGLDEGQTIIVSSLADFNDADTVYLTN